MYLSEDYAVFHIHERGEERLLRELELRRVIAERRAEREAELVAARAAGAVDPGAGVTDGGRLRRGIRALRALRVRTGAPASARS